MYVCMTVCLSVCSASGVSDSSAHWSRQHAKHFVSVGRLFALRQKNNSPWGNILCGFLLKFTKTFKRLCPPSGVIPVTVLLLISINCYRSLIALILRVIFTYFVIFFTHMFLHKTFKALNGPLCADVPLRNYSLNPLSTPGCLMSAQCSSSLHNCISCCSCSCSVYKTESLPVLLQRNHKTSFLSLFYSRCMNILTSPLFDVTTESNGQPVPGNNGINSMLVATILTMITLIAHQINTSECIILQYRNVKNVCHP